MRKLLTLIAIGAVAAFLGAAHANAGNGNGRAHSDNGNHYGHFGFSDGRFL